MKNTINTGYVGIFLHEYTHPDIKSIILDAKALKNEAIMKMASIFHAFLLKEFSLLPIPLISKHILLMHSPSSTFALRKRKRDHLGLVLEKIKYIHKANRDHHNDCDIDICTNAFLIDIDKRNPQHHKNRNDRLHDTDQRFRLLYTLDHNFILYMKRYSAIYIIDDVVTTGATLNALQNVLEEYFEKKIPIHTVAFAH